MSSELGRINSTATGSALSVEGNTDTLVHNSTLTGTPAARVSQGNATLDRTTIHGSLSTTNVSHLDLKVVDFTRPVVLSGIAELTSAGTRWASAVTLLLNESTVSLDGDQIESPGVGLTALGKSNNLYLQNVDFLTGLAAVQ